MCPPARRQPARQSTVPPTVFEVSFTHALDPQSLDAGDLLVNGISATARVTSWTATLRHFRIVASPVTAEGPQTMQMPAGGG